MKTGIKSISVRIFVIAGLMLAGVFAMGKTGWHEISGGAKVIWAAEKNTITPVLFTTNKSIKSADEINTAERKTEFRIGKNMYMVYSVGQKLTDSKLTYTITNSSGGQVAKWSVENMAGTYRCSYWTLDAAKLSNGQTYTLKVSGTASNVNIKTVSVKFTTYTSLSCTLKGGNKYVISGNKETLYVSNLKGGKTSSVQYQWGYSTNSSVSKMSEITTIPGATGSSYTVTANPTNNGRYFYYILNDGIGSIYRASGIWVKEQYEIKYNENYGKNRNIITDTRNYDDTSAYRITSAIPAMRTGYSFKGWATSAGSGVVKYKGGATYKPTASVTFYAVWGELTKVTILNKKVKLTFGRSSSLSSLTGGINAYSGAEFAYSSSNPGIVSVDSSGKVTAKAYGTATISVTAKYEASKETVKITVKPPKVTGVKVKKKKASSYEVRWKKIKGAAGNGIRYEVQYQKKKGKSWLSLSKVSGNKKTIAKNVSGYRFRVVAYKKGVKSDASKSVKAK